MNALIARVGQVFLVVTLMGMFLLGAVPLSAQAILITVGQNKVGTLADAPLQYSLSIETPQSIEVQVLGISAGLAPTFRIFDLSGMIVAEVRNTAGATIVEGSASLSSPGDYIIEVSSANATGGQFLISVQAGEFLMPSLVLGENQVGMIAGGEQPGTVQPIRARAAECESASTGDHAGVRARLPCVRC
ncbi:MAG: T9SS type A sorting domain-containing protein [Chloroflexi bacterium]|nr:T9SS type A sorting domain-containing protein [Chloroflexota bacterium]